MVKEYNQTKYRLDSKGGHINNGVGSDRVIKRLIKELESCGYSHSKSLEMVRKYTEDLIRTIIKKHKEKAKKFLKGGVSFYNETKSNFKTPQVILDFGDLAEEITFHSNTEPETTSHSTVTYEDLYRAYDNSTAGTTPVSTSTEATTDPQSTESTATTPVVTETPTNPTESSTSTQTTKRKISRGIRNKNYFNIRISKYNWNNSDGDDGTFVKFKTEEDGVRAGVINLDNGYFKKGYNTVRKIINRWSPKSDPGNSSAGVDNYANFVAKRLGVGLDDVIDSHNEEQMVKLLAAMARFENGLEVDINHIIKGYRMARGTA